jgi:hypothetical protein
MKYFLIKLNRVIKDFILFLRPYAYFGRSVGFFRTVANTLSLSTWISRNNKELKFSDFHTWRRDYNKREQLYEFVVNELNLDSENLDYLEFGVAAGNSFFWWTKRLKNKGTRFWGFDTFEGLPENWGFFSKGDMRSEIPAVDDDRVTFIKGLFQETLPEFLKGNRIEKNRRKIIHLDADLFSSTLFTLTSLAPFLNEGDVLFFDEFNVPNHEFLAFKYFSESYLISTKVLGAVNNFLQVAFEINGVDSCLEQRI